MRSQMEHTATRIGLFSLGLLLAMTGVISLSELDGVSVRFILAGTLTSIGVFCMLRSSRLLRDEPLAGQYLSPAASAAWMRRFASRLSPKAQR
jgi:hypothetical protein